MQGSRPATRARGGHDRIYVYIPAAEPEVERGDGSHRQREAGGNRGRDAHRVHRLRDERHRGARAAGRPRRAQARASADPVHDARDGAALDGRLSEVRRRRGRGHGQVPPPRRSRAVRNPRPHGPGLQPAVPARGRPGQLRLGRRRPAGGDAVHRGAHVVDHRRAARRHREGNRRLRRQLRRPPAPADGPAVQAAEPARQRLERDRGRHGNQHSAAQPWRDLDGHSRAHRQPRSHRRRPVRDRHRSRLPDRRDDLPLRGPAQLDHRRARAGRRHPAPVRHRPRPGGDARAGRLRGDPHRPHGRRGHRAARTRSTSRP